MIDRTLTDNSAYIDLLTETHVIRTRVQILDRNERVTSELTRDPLLYVTSGAVQVDVSADVTRTLSLGLIDPHGVAMLDPNAPSNSALFMDRFVKVFYDVYVNGVWVSCPIFHGPITKLEQDGINIALEAMGKEALMLAPALQWKTRRFSKGTHITGVIRALLVDHGEKRIKMPSLPRKLHKDLTVVGVAEPWLIIKKLAKQIDRQVFYDGDGYFRMRKFPENPVYNFSVGREVLTMPTQPLDFTTIRNTVRVLGPEPDQKKAKRVTAVAQTSQENAVSPANLGRNGKRRVLAEVVDDDHVKKQSEAMNEARRQLARLTVLSSDMSFESLVIPFLEESDPVHVTAPHGSYKFALKQFTIPMLPADSMSIGFLKRSRVRRIHRVKKVR